MEIGIFITTDKKEINMKRLENQVLYHYPDKTIAWSLFEETTYPWEVLPRIHDFILKTGAGLSPEEYDRVADHVWVAKSAKVAPTAFLGDCVIVGPQAEVRHCAFVRGNAVIGTGCVVGNSTELKNVILFDGVQVPHYNYVGDSILGYRSHMGAGSITSNVKSDKKLIRLTLEDQRIDTNMKKIGGLLGDYVEVGCGTIINPGSIVGCHTNIYPLSSVRGYVPEGSIYKNRNEIVAMRQDD